MDHMLTTNSGAFGKDWPAHPAGGWACVAFVCMFHVHRANASEPSTDLCSFLDVYVVVFGLTYGPLIWTLPSEVYQNVNRAKGVGLAVAVSWLANFVIVSIDCYTD